MTMTPENMILVSLFIYTTCAPGIIIQHDSGAVLPRHTWPSLLTFMALSLYPRNRPCPPHPPTPIMLSVICWCHVFLGLPRLLVPGNVRSIVPRVTLFASLRWACPNQRRRPHINSWIYASCTIYYYESTFFVSHVIPPEHSDDPAKNPHLRGSDLPLVVHLHCPAFASICQSRSYYGIVYFRFEPSFIFQHNVQHGSSHP